MANPERSSRIVAAVEYIADLFRRIDSAVEASVAATLKDVIGEQFEAANLGFIPEVWTQKVTAFMIPILEDAYQTGAISAAIQLPASKAAYETAVPSPVPEVLNPLQAERMGTYLNRLKGIGDHVWQIAREDLAAGMTAGEGIPDLASRVRASAEVSTRRAVVIARTEVISAANAGSMDQARIFAPYAPVRKEWLCTHDSRTRPDHLAADSQEVDLDDPFMVGGVPLDHPGDPTGVAGQVINCRCTVLFNDVSAAEQMPRGNLDVVNDLTAAAEEVPVPYHVAQDAEGCSGYAVVKDSDGEVMGCHDTQEEADAQVAALYANEPDATASVEAQEGEEWHSVLAPEGVRSGDGREFAAGSLDWRSLPLPLMREVVSSHGGDTSETVRTGDITRIERVGTDVHGWGNFHDTPEGEAHRAFVAGGRRGVSIDGDNTTEGDVEYIYPDGLDPESDEALMAMPEVVRYHYARIMGVTDVPFPAFQEAYIELVGAEIPVTGDGATGSPEESGEGDVPEEFANSGIMLALVPDAETVSRLSLGPDLGLEDDDLHLTLRYLGSVGETDESLKEQALAAAADLANQLPLEGEAFATALFNPTGDEPAVVMLVDSDPVRELEAGIDEALKAPDSHAFNPHISLEYPAAEAFGEAFQRGVERAGPVRFDRVRVAWGDENRFFPEDEEPVEDELLASAFPVRPPTWWFDKPDLDGPTPFTVKDDGRVYGHLALDGTCHIGVAGTCVTPPREEQFTYFQTGSVVTDDGSMVAVGQITLGTGHADRGAGAFAAAEHYDHTGTAAADVTAYRDRWGIAVAGAARPELTDVQIRQLRAGAISGDWRKFGTGLRLVAALMVNVPGFPIPRTSTFTRRGEQTALVAAGVVTEAAPFGGPSQEFLAGRVERIAAEVGWDRESTAERLARTFEEA